MTDFPGVTFLPWIGDRYHDSSPRLLIAGHSSYRADETNRDHLRQVVIQDMKNPRGLYPQITQILLGKRCRVTPEIQKREWSRIAFHNVCQFSMRAPRWAPSPQQWADSQEPFHTVVRALRPTAILVVGVTTRIDQSPEGIPLRRIRHPRGRGFRYACLIPQVRDWLESPLTCNSMSSRRASSSHHA